MNRRRVGALVAPILAVALAASLAATLPARSEEDAWSASALRERFPGPERDAQAKDEDFGHTKQCKECHEDKWKELASAVHAALLDEKKSGTRGCESCHGPGAKHVDDGGDTPMRDPLFTADLPKPAPKKQELEAGEAPRAPPAVVPVREMNGICLRCHVGEGSGPGVGKKLSPRHRAWVTPKSAPERSCVSCHKVHVPTPAIDAAARPFATIAQSTREAAPTDPALCVRCHSTMDAPPFHPEMARSGHAFLLVDGPEHGCAACHGAGSLHVTSGGDPSKIVNPRRQAAQEVDRTCNACHLEGRAVEKWTCAEHARQGVSCNVCHDSNAARGRTLRKPEFELCGQCHLDVKAQFRLPNRHRVAEGRVSCTDCHDPHGNRNLVRDRDVRLTACVACHQDKTGPFVFDHGIKRTDGCVACHDPHGSTNKRMLTFARTRPLCLQCHPDTSHDLSDRRYANCLDCHTEIHGSDLNRFFLR